MKVTLCIGSSCHLRGAHYVVERVKELIAEHSLHDKIEIAGVFCMHHCGGKGVSVTVDDDFYSVTPDEIDSFFAEKILAKL